MLSSVLFTTFLIASSSAAPAPGSDASQQSPCKAGFLNTVFNTGSSKHAGWPDQIWGNLTAHGVNDFIAFSLGPLDQKITYDTAKNVPARYNQAMEAARIPMVVDPLDTNAAQTWIASKNPPGYLELFNEPDYSYDDATLLTKAVDAAHNLSTIFSSPHPYTTFISPAVAYTDSDYLTTFRDNCNGCFSQIPIVSMHLYESDVDSAIAAIEKLHTTWQDQRIWITELAPKDAKCTYDSTGVVNYAKELIPKIAALGYVDKIFWNWGDYEPQSCDSSLTYDDGSATDVLKGLAEICGVSGS